MEPGSCLDLVCGGGEHSCDGRFCVRIQFLQNEELATWCASPVQHLQCSHTGDARIRTQIGDGIEREIMAWSVTNGPKAHQRMEDWP